MGSIPDPFLEQYKNQMKTSVGVIWTISILSILILLLQYILLVFIYKMRRGLDGGYRHVKTVVNVDQKPIRISVIPMPHDIFRESEGSINPDISVHVKRFLDDRQNALEVRKRESEESTRDALGCNNKTMTKEEREDWDPSRVIDSPASGSDEDGLYLPQLFSAPIPVTDVQKIMRDRRRAWTAI